MLKNLKKSGSQSSGERLDLLDWLKGAAIIAVILDHRFIVPQAFVVWSVNIFVLVTAAVYARPGYVFPGKKIFHKMAHLFFVVAFAVFFFDFLYSLAVKEQNRALLSVLLNPYYFFVKNPYLGDILYVTLHLQILLLFYFFLKVRPLFKPQTVFIAAVIVAIISYAVSHSLIHRFKTIFVGEWLIYIAAGFYGLLPLLKKIEKCPHNRFFWLSVSLFSLVAIYALYPLFPLAFTNRNRCSFLMLPLYFFLIVFLSELFWILTGFPAGKWIRSIGSLLGHHTLAIYLTHQAFATLWFKMISSSGLVALLSIGSGILFGMLTNQLFTLLWAFADGIVAAFPASKS